MSPGFAAATAAAIVPTPGCTQMVCVAACAGNIVRPSSAVAATETMAVVPTIFM